MSSPEGRLWCSKTSAWHAGDSKKRQRCFGVKKKQRLITLKPKASQTLESTWTSRCFWDELPELAMKSQHKALQLWSSLAADEVKDLPQHAATFFQVPAGPKAAATKENGDIKIDVSTFHNNLRKQLFGGHRSSVLCQCLSNLDSLLQSQAKNYSWVEYLKTLWCGDSPSILSESRL